MHTCSNPLACYMWLGYRQTDSSVSADRFIACVVCLDSCKGTCKPGTQVKPTEQHTHELQV